MEFEYYKCRVNLNNLSYIKAQAENTNQGEKESIKHFVPSLMLTNAMSLAPKIDEVRSFILDSNLDAIHDNDLN